MIFSVLRDRIVFSLVNVFFSQRKSDGPMTKPKTACPTARKIHAQAAMTATASNHSHGSRRQPGSGSMASRNILYGFMCSLITNPLRGYERQLL
jgi:hypothetical protein